RTARPVGVRNPAQHTPAPPFSNVSSPRYPAPDSSPGHGTERMATAFQTLSETEWEQVEQIWDLLEDGELEAARTALTGLEKSRGRHPDLRIVEAALALEAGEPERAIDALHGAERAADPSQFFQLRALAHFDLVRLELARDDAERALTIHRDFPEAHDLMARVLEHLGDEAGAEEHGTEAARLDPEAFPRPLEVDDAEFDAMVEKSVRELPERVRKELDEVPLL